MEERETRLLMLVDDEPAQCRLVSAIASRAGWRTVFARDAETAIAMLGTQDGMMLDAILLDQWVPGSDSATLIVELKARRPALPILLMTAIGSNESAIEAMRAGASDYIIKPVAAERLIAALTMGIAVEDCIHYLYRYRLEFSVFGDGLKTMYHCHANIARAGFYTTLVVCFGFSILVLSNFTPSMLFGILTTVAMAIAILAALTLMPKLLIPDVPSKSASLSARILVSDL